MSTCLICYKTTFCPQNRQYMILYVVWEIWNQALTNLSCNFNSLPGDTLDALIGISRFSNKCSIEFRSCEFSKPLSDDSTDMTWCIILLLNTITGKKYCCHELVHVVCNDVQVMHRSSGLVYKYYGS